MNLANINEETTLPRVAAALVSIFVLTHGWVLMSYSALYWDDWSILTSDSSELHRMFKFVGFELAGYLHVWLVPLGAGAYRLLMLSSLALMSACVFWIARHHGLKVLQAGLITALFIVAPLNTSKIAAINAPAVMFAAIFFLAWVLLLADLQRPSLLKRLGALVLFSVSFYLPSSLAFFALPAMSIAWRAYRSNSAWRQRLTALFKRIDFLALPFIQFAVFRLYFFKPDASIANEYHQFGIRSSRLQEALERIQTDILLDMPWAIRIVLIVLPLVVLLRMAKPPPAHQVDPVRRADVLMFMGMLACLFALLPYLAVGRLPVFSDWNSRYQLFLPLGFALICMSLSQYIAAYAHREWAGVGIYALLLVLSAGFSVRSYFEYANDSKKQNQLMATIKEQPFVSDHDNVVFIDSVTYAKRRDVRYNEYTQMMRAAYPAWNGIALSDKQLQRAGGGSLKQYMTFLGGIENIESEPRLYGLPNDWRWSDSCAILVAAEIDGRVQLRRWRGQPLVKSPCVLNSPDNY